MTQQEAKTKLIHLLQNAYSGELAAYYAYEGHQQSVSDDAERQELIKIRDEEWVHRECVGRILAALGAVARPRRELLMTCIGKTIGFLCKIGGWLIPMYGAGKLEAGNIVEYQIAAQWAIEAGHPEFVEDLLEMAEIEWDHELYFRQKYLSHKMGYLLPLWKLPAPRESLRELEDLTIA